MKVKQQTVNTFEFLLSGEDEEVFFKYVNQNEPLLKGHILILNSKNISIKMKEFLVEKNICFIEKNCELTVRKKSVIQLPNISIENALEKMKEFDEVEEEPHQKRKHNIRELIEKPIRSGTSISTKNDLAILSQINNGSEVDVDGNLEMFGTINGKVICNGTYMLIRDIGETGYVIFNGVILEKDKFRTRKAKLIKLNNNKLIIEEL